MYTKIPLFAANASSHYREWKSKRHIETAAAHTENVVRSIETTANTKQISGEGEGSVGEYLKCVRMKP